MAIIYGDEALRPRLSGNQKGGNQIRIGGDNTNNTLIGDVDFIIDEAEGGDATLTARFVVNVKAYAKA